LENDNTADHPTETSVLETAYDQTLEAWARASEIRDRETQGHSLRITALTLMLAREMGVPEEELPDIRRGALLHDIGKVGIPDSILQKPGLLSDEEWQTMRLHPKIGYELLAPVPFLQKANEIVYCHHERWDGMGYPRGISREQIPRSARIFSVADVWDSVRSDRPQRAAWSIAQSRTFIEARAGTQFDAEAVKAFSSLLHRGKWPT
jgi:putative nucleotidyltransferase with HDIG domain